MLKNLTIEGKNMVKEVSAGAIVYTIENNKPLFLLVQHNHGNHFSFPKGHIEKGESIMETAKREVYEETGIMIEFTSDKMQVNTYLMPNGVYKDVYYFLAKASNHVIKFPKDEIRHAGWYNYDQVLQYLTYDNDKIIFLKLVKELKYENNR